MTQPTLFQLSLTGATWIDVNSQFTVNSLPGRVPDELAIANSIFNLLNCPIGARSRTFQPQYGTLWYQFLQEPIDDVTSRSIRVAFFQALAQWEPRITIDMTNSFVQPDLSIPGYNLRLSYTTQLSSLKQSASYNLQAV